MRSSRNEFPWYIFYEASYVCDLFGQKAQKELTLFQLSRHVHTCCRDLVVSLRTVQSPEASTEAHLSRENINSILCDKVVVLLTEESRLLRTLDLNHKYCIIVTSWHAVRPKMTKTVGLVEDLPVCRPFSQMTLL